MEDYIERKMSILTQNTVFTEKKELTNTILKSNIFYDKNKDVYNIYIVNNNGENIELLLNNKSNTITKVITNISNNKTNINTYVDINSNLLR